MAPRPRTHAEKALDLDDLGSDSNIKNRRMAGLKPDRKRGKNPALPTFNDGATGYWRSHESGNPGQDFGNAKHNAEVDRR